MDWRITLHFDSNPATFRAIRKAMVALFQGVGGTSTDAFDLEVAVGEALASLYRRGDRNRPGPVDLVFSTTDGMVEIILTSFGPVPQEPLAVPTIDAPHQHRGLYLIGHMMDHVEFTYPVRDGQGVSIRMVKALTPHPASRSA